jgi:diguanylate cyclase (GGDEF)-like protein
MMCDIDHFKKINDQHGHIAGDNVIRKISEVLKTVTRDEDIIGRYGGEEFCILIRNTSRDKAAQSAERLRSRIAGLIIDNIQVTASFGLAFTEPGIPAAKELLQRADIALYKAKNEGRDCVVIWEEPAEQAVEK